MKFIVLIFLVLFSFNLLADTRGLGIDISRSGFSSQSVHLDVGNSQFAGDGDALSLAIRYSNNGFTFKVRTDSFMDEPLSSESPLVSSAWSPVSESLISFELGYHHRFSLPRDFSLSLGGDLGIATYQMSNENFEASAEQTPGLTYVEDLDSDTYNSSNLPDDEPISGYLKFTASIDYEIEPILISLFVSANSLEIEKYEGVYEYVPPTFNFGSGSFDRVYGVKHTIEGTSEYGIKITYQF